MRPVWRSTLQGWKARAALLAWVAALYANSLGNGFHYDDTHSLVDNPHVRSLSEVGRFFRDPGTFSAMPQARMYRPLLLCTYAINHALGGYAPFGYHLVNVLLHGVNAVLVLALARRILGSHGTALAAAFLFAAHPVLTETVDYVSSRSESLAALFVLAAAVLFLDARQRARWGHHGALTALAAAALLSKSTGIVVVPLGLLYLLSFRSRRGWALLTGPTLVAAAYVVGTRAIIGKALLEPVRSAASQVGTQVKAIPLYAYKCLVPANLSVEPQFAEAAGVWAPAIAVAGALVLCLVGAVVALRRLCPAAAYGAGWFALCLAPPTVVPLNVLVNEHRLYLPLVGGVLLAGALLGAAGRRLGWFAPLLLAVWAALVIERNRDWQSEETVWADAVRKGPLMSRSQVNLGKAYLEQGRYDEAIAASRRALAIDPDLARAHYNIGTAHLRQGKLDEAIASYQRTLEIDPDMMEALNNLGNAHRDRGDLPRALALYRRALQVVDHASIHHNLGSTFLAAGQVDSAIISFQRALDLDPTQRETVEGLARSLRRGDRLDAAAQLLGRSLQRWPQDAELLGLLADTHAALGRDREALAAYGRAGLSEVDGRLRLAEAAQQRQDWERAEAQLTAGLALAPQDARLHNALGEIHYARLDRDAALAAFRHAAELDPRLADAFRNIGLVYLRHGRPTEATAALERARDLEQGSKAATLELLARAYAGSRRLGPAIDAYRRAIARDPARAELHHNLAALYQETGDLAAAEGLYREAIARDPGLVQAHFNLGFLLLEQGRYSEAAGAIERAIELDPQQPEAYVNLASAYLNLGQGERAESAYERFLELHAERDETRAKVERQLQLLRAAD